MQINKSFFILLLVPVLKYCLPSFIEGRNHQINPRKHIDRDESCLWQHQSEATYLSYFIVQLLSKKLLHSSLQQLRTKYFRFEGKAHGGGEKKKREKEKNLLDSL